jgi:DDE superfamily endonuclease
MSVASLETTLDLWASSLRAVKGRMRPLFTQDRIAASANAFLDGLLGPERRKTGWMRAEAAGDKGPWRQQAILGRARWEADALRDIVRDYALETLADPDAVLVFDETGFLKQGKASCGVAPVRRAKSPTARLACLLPMPRVTAMPSSIAPYICRSPGRVIQAGVVPPMCQRRLALPPSRSSPAG